jgi:hypothetical protein
MTLAAVDRLTAPQYSLAETRRAADHVGTETKGWARALDLSYSQSCVFPLLAKRFTAQVGLNTVTDGQKPLSVALLQHLSGKLLQWLATDELKAIQVEHRLFSSPVRVIDYDVMTQ